MLDTTFWEMIELMAVGMFVGALVVLVLGHYMGTQDDDK